MTMKQSLIAWVCVLVMAFGCSKSAHVVERAENASIGVRHQANLDKCFDDLVATVQTTQDHEKASAEYKVCADAADKDAGAK